MPLGDVWRNSWGDAWNGHWAQSSVAPPTPSAEQNSGGYEPGRRQTYLSFNERQEGYDAFVKARRIELGILPAEPQPAPSPAVTEAVAAATERQSGLRMSPEQRQADLLREFQARNLEYKDEYRQALYANLYARELRQRGTLALLMYLASE